jgi:hypothetical protein
MPFTIESLKLSVGCKEISPCARQPRPFYILHFTFYISSASQSATLRVSREKPMPTR